MNKEVEILKIAYTAGPINDRMFIVVSNAGPVYDYYVSILKSKYPDNKFYKTTKNVVTLFILFISSWNHVFLFFVFSQ